MMETSRLCGTRKISGTYLVSDPGFGFSCKQIPYIIERCPVCGGGIKFGRGFGKIIPKKIFERAQDCKCFFKVCPFKLDTISYLGWVGEQFYSPESFAEEASRLGVSKRISAIPRDLQLGNTWIFLAHPKAGFKDNHSVPAVFYVFKPSRIERIVTETEFQDSEKMDKLRNRGITPIAVPDVEQHHGSVFDEKPKKNKEAKQTKIDMVGNIEE